MSPSWRHVNIANIKKPDMFELPLLMTQAEMAVLIYQPAGKLIQDAAAQTKHNAAVHAIQT